jgi:hypothetical protein
MPTTTFCCGAECGQVVGSAAVADLTHWDLDTGTPVISTSVYRAAGGGIRSHQFSAAGSACDLRKTITATTVQVARAYVYFDVLPDIACNIFGFFTASSNFVGIRYNPTGTKLEGICAAVVSTDSAVVTTGVWYRLDIRGTVSAALVLDSQVDGVALAQVSTGAATTITSYRIGLGVSGSPAVTGTMYADDQETSGTSGDYPLGAGTVTGFRPIADGAHNFEAVGDFTYDGVTGIDPAATDTYTYVDDNIDNTTDFVAASAADAGEYLEWTLGTFPVAVNAIHGITVVGGHHAAGTAVNKQSLHFLDGQTDQAVFDDADMSATTLSITGKHFATAPSTAAAWTQAQVEALRLRWGSTFGATEDIVPVPYLDSLCVEVGYTQDPPVTLTLNQALACFGIDNLVQFSVGDPPNVGVEGAPGNAFVRRLGLGTKDKYIRRFMRPEDQ